jgi:type I restriction enzyme R subunit
VNTFYAQLITFARALNAEDQRAIALGLAEEELAIFDLLTKPNPKLTRAEEEQVRALAQALLGTLKQNKLVLDWRKKQQARAEVRISIEKYLERLPSKYTPSLYRAKCDVIYQHVYDSYYGAGGSVYALAA